MEQYIILNLWSVNVTITNIAVGLIIATLLIIYLNLGHTKCVPNNRSILSESLYHTILQMLNNYLGTLGVIYLPLFYSLFHIILLSNLIGLIPYSSTPTVELIGTCSLAITLLMGILLKGILTHGPKIGALFLPGGTPIALIPLMVILEIIAYLSRTISLGLRLAINLITGHILAKVISGFLWLGYIHGTSFLIILFGLSLLSVFLTLELLVAYLQAYIFVFITILTLKDITMH